MHPSKPTSKALTQKVSYRLPERVGTLINGLAHRTGWSESYAAGFLVSLGYAGLRRRAKEVEARRKVVVAQVGLAKVQREAVEEGRKIKAAAAALSNGRTPRKRPARPAK